MLAEPTIAEDLLLLLFQPDVGVRPGRGAIAGEGTLYAVLAGAVLAELALGEHVRATRGGSGVEVVDDRPPTDALLRAAWNYIAQRPRAVQTVLAAIGPTLRAPVLARVVDRGDIVATQHRYLGLFESTVLEDADSDRRARLMTAARAVLVDGAAPSPRTAALVALLWASGTLPQFDPEIPWSSAVIARARELEQGDWGAGAAGEAVQRTVLAIFSATVASALSAPSQP